MAERLRVGIVGCGGISRTHISIYAEHLCQEAIVVAVCDLDEERAQQRALTVQSAYQDRAKRLQERLQAAPADVAEQLREEFGVCQAASRPAHAYRSVQEMLENESLDIVQICVPPFAHAETTIAAAEHGVHVFCEGPIAGSLREADAMLAAAREHGVVFTVQYGHTRVHRTVLMAKRAIEAGYLGRLVSGQVQVLWYRAQSYYDSDPWRGTWAGERGGALYHHGRYAVDLYLWLMGEVREVYGRIGTYTHAIEVEDAAEAALHFCNGALGTILATTAAHPNPEVPNQRVEIFGERASVAVLPTFSIGSADADYAAELRRRLEEEVPPLPLEGMAGQIRNFVQTVRGRETLLVTPESTRPQLEVTKAVYKSAALRAPVELPIWPHDPYYVA